MLTKESATDHLVRLCRTACAARKERALRNSPLIAAETVLALILSLRSLCPVFWGTARLSETAFKLKFIQDFSFKYVLLKNSIIFGFKGPSRNTFKIITVIENKNASLSSQDQGGDEI